MAFMWIDNRGEVIIYQVNGEGWENRADKAHTFRDTETRGPGGI